MTAAFGQDAHHDMGYEIGPSDSRYFKLSLNRTKVLDRTVRHVGFAYVELTHCSQRFTNHDLKSSATYVPSWTGGPRVDSVACTGTDSIEVSVLCSAVRFSC